MNKNKLDPAHYNTGAFAELTELQLAYGYEPTGFPVPVALLGLFGEAGEVLNEVYFPFKDELNQLREACVFIAQQADKEKKRLRADPGKSTTVAPRTVNLDRFDLEVADALYYLNLIALGRGLTLAHYAALSVEKVKAKGLLPVEPKKESHE